MFFQQSDLYKAWDENAKFILNRCRRSDRAHFDVCCKVRSLPIRAGLELALERYPPRDERARWNLTVTHRRRMKINDEIQRSLAKNIEPKKWIEDAEVPFHIFPGTLLIGRNNDHSKVKTGAFLVATDFDDTGVEMHDEFDMKPFKLTFEQVAKHTRLRHAMTLYSTQGRSLLGTIEIHDWNNRHFSSTSLYVALSRAKESDKIWLAKS